MKRQVKTFFAKLEDVNKKLYDHQPVTIEVLVRNNQTTAKTVTQP